MNIARGINDSSASAPAPEEDAGVSDRPLEIGTDERRMHVRAYNHWVSLLQGRPYPSIESLEPAEIADFGPHSVLLDFSKGIDNPAIRYLGHALRAECGVDGSITHVAQVPSRSLLSRLTDHYLQIIANRAPIGFEAEFVGQRGHNTLYRGILMPFSSSSDTIDFIYGVINWKELVDPATQAQLTTEVEQARRAVPRSVVAAPVWADGPSSGFDAQDEGMVETASGTSLADRLLLARDSAATARASEARSRTALYRAMGRAYDFALAAEQDAATYGELLANAEVANDAETMTASAQLIFGTDYGTDRLTEFAMVLAHARRVGVPRGELESFLGRAEGGLEGVVRAERARSAP